LAPPRTTQKFKSHLHERIREVQQIIVPVVVVNSCTFDGTSEVESKKQWKDAVLSILDGAVSAGSGDEQIKVKKLRKLVLLSLQQEDSDKAAKNV
jgi:hypothetical protein